MLQKNLKRAPPTELVDEMISYAAAYCSIAEPYLPALRALNIHSPLAACPGRVDKRTLQVRWVCTSVAELLVSSSL